jgi:hypothetical protein
MPRFNSCCDQEEELEFDCPCDDTVPVAMTTVFVEFDLDSLLLQEESFDGELSFNCCDGNQTLAPASGEEVFPTGFSVGFDIASSTDGTFGFTVSFQNQTAYGLVPSTGNFIIHYTACGNEISQQINWTLINSCEVSVPVLSPVTITWDINTDDGATEDVIIDLTTIECCSVPEQARITALSTIPANTGVSYTGFPVGYGFVGVGNIPLSFEFETTGVTNSTSFIFYADILVCNQYTIRQIVYFIITDIPPSP